MIYIVIFAKTLIQFIMIIDIPYIGKCDDEQLGKFINRLKCEYQTACELKKTLGIINNSLTDNEIKSNIKIEYSVSVEHAYNVQMLLLRDRILREIKNFMLDTQ